MTLPEAVEIYLKCLEQKDCSKCPIQDKEFVSDRSICSLLTQAELRAEMVAK